MFFLPIQPPSSTCAAHLLPVAQISIATVGLDSSHLLVRVNESRLQSSRTNFVGNGLEQALFQGGQQMRLVWHFSWL